MTKMNDAEIQAFFVKYNVCFVTNSKLDVDCTYMQSLKTYIDYVPEDRYLVIPGANYMGLKNFYGANCFNYMVQYLASVGYDYAVYVDDDLFVSDMNLLVDDLYAFMKGDYCIGGVQDGGVICHRNGSKVMVNTFISFWNIKALRENISAYLDACTKGVTLGDDIISRMDVLSDNKLKEMKAYRMTTCPQGVRFLDVVRNNPDNPVAPHQEPYTYLDANNDVNFEPYYVVERAMVSATGLPLYYMCACDFNDIRKETLDDGCASVVMRHTDDGHYTPYAYHTWYSRMYSHSPKTDLQKKETARIKSIINFVRKMHES